jgi:biopolymer transport protein ExbD
MENAMAEKRRILDVWLIENNLVYRDVPYTVVTDWIQQGRLLGEDQVRAAGGPKWYRLEAVPALAAFLPRAEPARIEDRAEALEPVVGELSWRRPKGEEEGDVDMIPLIDISLVLLIFFMMSAAVGAGVFSPIATPPAQHQLLKLSEGMYWVGVDARDPEKKTDPVYSLGKDQKQFVEPTPDLNRIKAALKDELGKLRGDVKIRLRGDENLPLRVIQALIVDLQEVEAMVNRERDRSGRVKLDIAAEVSEPKRR